MPKRVTFILPDLSAGGAERVAITLAQAFEVRDVFVDFVLFNASGPLLTEVPGSSRVINLECRKFRDGFGAVARYLRNTRPEAVLAFMWPLTSICVAANVAAGRPSKIFTVDHTTESAHARSGGLTRQISTVMSMRLTYPLAHGRISISSGVRADIAKLSGMAPSKFVIIPNPVAPAPPSSPEAENLWCARPGRRVITVGNLISVKNHDLLIRAFAALPDQQAQLMIVGEGSERRTLETLIRDLSLGDRVILTGFRRDARSIMASADVFVLSSNYEGLPLALIEGLAAGLSCVSTDCENGPAEILDGNLGQLVPVADVTAMTSAIQIAFDRRPDPRARKQRIQEYSPARIADLYLTELLGLGLVDHNQKMRAAAEKKTVGRRS